MAREHRQDPRKQQVPRYHSDVTYPAPVWQAIEAYRKRHGMKRAHAVRALVTAELRRSGELPPLLKPEDAKHLEDVRGFPWHFYSGLNLKGSTAKPKSLVWFSRDPERLTWATLFHAMEHETETRLEDIAKRHGISYTHAYRMFRRFDLWRNGEDTQPRLNVLRGLSRRGGIRHKRAHG